MIIGLIKKMKKSKCCNADIEIQGRYGGEKSFEYCKKCGKRQDLLADKISFYNTDLYKTLFREGTMEAIKNAIDGVIDRVLEQKMKKIKKAFFEMMVPDHRSSRDGERNRMWEDFLRILNQ